ncbi:MAG: glutamine-hydrolyzing carbamoyl-phosphate synthase small subunit [Nitrospirae bacterium]|nr:glutamine-hydrolyzing carbamoyl-phosphate synthase small subunit [Nitrospirota bacterium]
MKAKKAVLILEDGKLFEGFSFGAEGETSGEVVFNTSMTGYQEIITDPSYQGQLVTMTYPHIGNYGINDSDHESRKPFLEGLIVKEVCFTPQNYYLSKTLTSYLKENNIIGIYGIETRTLTRHLRNEGLKLGIISTLNFDPDLLLSRLKENRGVIGQDLAKEVTCSNIHTWIHSREKPENQKLKVLVYDFGVKENILRMLSDKGCEVVVLPADTSCSKVLDLAPDGVLLSNGPGDPEAVSYAIKNVEKLVGKLPIFGICLGHQILGLAMGGKTYKLKFGHHGGNQPVMDLTTKKVEITAQNHGFAVDIDSISSEMELTHINLNDQTVEGMRHRSLPVFSVQYHPEASPGPHDAGYLFDRFIQLMEKNPPNV